MRFDFLAKNGFLTLCTGAVLCALLFGGRAEETRAVFANYSATEQEDQKVVYLTIDDGPSPMTVEVLKVLKQKGVKATFFVTAERKDCAYLFQELIDDGHAIGLHCYNHSPEKNYAYKQAFIDDFTKIQDYVKEQTGLEPKICRFMCGSRNNVLPIYLEGELQSYLSEIGFTFYDWNAVSGDSMGNYDAQTLANNIIKQGGEKPVIMALFHDIPTSPTTPEAIRMVIDHYQKLGYTFEVITDQTPPIQFDWKR